MGLYTQHNDTEYNVLMGFVMLSATILCIIILSIIVSSDIIIWVTMRSVVSDTQHNDTQYNVWMGYVILSVVMLCVVVLSVLAAKLGGHLMRRVRKLIGEKRKKFVEPSFTLIN